MARKYKQQLFRSRREPFVEHHQRTYGGELPIWVAIEVWDFGMLSKLFAGMKLSDQDLIAQKNMVWRMVGRLPVGYVV